MCEPVCPLCYGELSCLAGRSAHPSNWYCSDEEGCGWEAWSSPVAAVQEKPKKVNGGSQELKMYLVYDGFARFDIEEAQIIEALGQKTEKDAISAFDEFYTEPEYALVSHVLDATGTVLSDPELVQVNVLMGRG